MILIRERLYAHPVQLKVNLNDLMIEHGRTAADLRTFTQEVLVCIPFETPLYCD
jgi:hypothetical protein